MKNYINQTFLFTSFVVALLMLLHFLPTTTLAGYELRDVDILSDIRNIKSEKVLASEKNIEGQDYLVPDSVNVELVDTCKTGIVCIKDYADSYNRGMKPFYDALHNRKRLNRPVRIAYFGDSFIEADILTGDLRSKLQSFYGGCGVGFVPVTSTTYGFRPTVKHSFQGWSSHFQTDKTGFDRSKQGIAGSYFIPSANAFVELRGQNKYGSHLDTCEVVNIYYTSSGEVELESVVNKNKIASHRSKGDKYMNSIQVEDRIGSVRWTVKNAEDAVFYGVAMDGKQGISLDNFALRSTTGALLKTIPNQTLTEFGKVRPYDLIILQYGLNIATKKGTNYDYYTKSMLATIDHLKACFPNAGFLLISVGARDYKTPDGEYHTMPGVINLIDDQEELAAKCGIAFWNMYEAMGGDGSIAKLVHSKPSKANRDYTHINFRGGKHMAELLYETLIYGKEQYDARKK